MHIRFPILGLELDLSVRRRGNNPGEFLFIPESGLLDHIRSYVTLTTQEQVLRRINYFKNTNFWEGDTGYNFVKKHLLKLVGTGCRIIDVGHSSGAFPCYLKHLNLWHRVNYWGIDIDEKAVELVQKEYPEGRFLACDLLKPLDLLDKSFDIVYSKGTICVTYFPYQALDAILKLASKYVLLISTPLTKKHMGGKHFVSTVHAHQNNAYLFTIMNESFFTNYILKKGFRILDKQVHFKTTAIINFGSYRLYDHLLVRESSD